MAQWEDVNPDLIPNFRESHRGRVSYPLLKSFLESGLGVARLDRTGLQQSMMSLNSCLNAYIKSHNLPIKLFQRAGEIFAARTDTDDDGKPNPVYNDIHKIPRTGQLQPASEQEIEEAPPITDQEVENRYGVDKNRTAA